MRPSRRSRGRTHVHKVARFSAEDRRDIFSEAAAKLGIRPSIIEKDFWVCFVLKMLFAESPFKESLVFKGGTSLSKVYGLIDRFSEDIDLVLDWEIIGFGDGPKDPMQTFQSKSKQDQFNKEINRVAAQFISGKLRPQIDDLVRREEIGLSATVDSEDPQVINIHYPAAFTEAYIRPEVRLEIGPLASWVPSSAHVIQPYAFDICARWCRAASSRTDLRLKKRRLRSTPADPGSSFSEYQTKASTASHSRPYRPGLVTISFFQFWKPGANRSVVS